MSLFDRFFHRHEYGLLKVVDTCERHEVWFSCKCGKVVHQVLRDELLHEYGPYEYSKGTNTRSFRGIDLSVEPCDIKTRYCVKCGFRDLTKV